MPTGGVYGDWANSAEPDRRLYFFVAGLGAAAAFFDAFCFLVFEVFFGLLSPIELSFLKIHLFVASILAHPPCSS
jgi:hypothetical protein